MGGWGGWAVPCFGGGGGVRGWGGGEGCGGGGGGGGGKGGTEGSNRCGRKKRRRVTRSGDDGLRDRSLLRGSQTAPAGHSAADKGSHAGRHVVESESGSGSEPRPAAVAGEGMPISTSTQPGRVSTEGQSKPARKAHSLIDKVYLWKNLYTAWRRVRANKGAHGLDRVTIRHFEADWETHLREIHRHLQENRFTPLPPPTVHIP